MTMENEILVDTFLREIKKHLPDWLKSNDEKLEISIKKGMSPKEKKITLLHEMIHAYESELQLSGYNHPRELVLLHLYKKLIKRLGEKKTNEIIKIASQSIFWQASHSILFTLKTIDLDLRLKLPLGSIFAYGKTDWFSKIKY